MGKKYQKKVDHFCTLIQEVIIYMYYSYNVHHYTEQLHKITLKLLQYLLNMDLRLSQ